MSKLRGSVLELIRAHRLNKSNLKHYQILVQSEIEQDNKDPIRQIEMIGKCHICGSKLEEYESFQSKCNACLSEKCL